MYTASRGIQEEEYVYFYVNIIQISFAVPGAERNLTNENAPAIATPAPILPLTSIITNATIIMPNINAILFSPLNPVTF